MEIKKRENIPENRQVRLTVAVDRGTWQDALMHCYNGIKALCPVEGEPTREKIEAVYGSDFLYQEAVNETYPQALVEAISQSDIQIAGTPTLTVEEIGADGYRAQLLPEQKADAVLKLQTQGNGVVMVGDGINDAPVLSRADIGVAMGAMGSDAAIEAADVVLFMQDYQDSRGAMLEWAWCQYVGKQTCFDLATFGGPET